MRISPAGTGLRSSVQLEGGFILALPPYPTGRYRLSLNVSFRPVKEVCNERDGVLVLVPDGQVTCPKVYTQPEAHVVLLLNLKNK